MTNSGDVEALKAAMRGVRTTAEALSTLSPRVEALDARADAPDTDLEDLRRLSSAHALAAQALRALVETLGRKRGTTVEEAATGAATGGEAE
jgi:phage tail tape-measure protein